MTIRRRLTLGYITIALLIGIAGFMAFKLSSRLESNVETAAREAAVRTMEAVDRAISHRIEQLQTQARERDLANKARISGEEFDRIPDLAVLLEQIDEDWKLGRENPHIDQIFESELSKTLQDLTRFLEEDYGFPLFPEIFVTNKHGVVIAASGQPSDYLQSDEPWYAETLVRDDFWIGDLSYSVSSDFYTLEVAVQLRDSAGRFAGVMKAAVNLEEVRDILRSAESKTRERLIASYLISAERQLIFAYDDLGEPLSKTRSEAFFGATDVLPQEALDAADELWKPPQQEAATFFVRRASSGFRRFSGLGWTCVLELDVRDSVGAARALRNTVLAVHSVAFLFAVLIGFVVARSVSRPLIGLEEATREIESGRLETRIQIASDDEIGYLASSFNQMLEELHDAHVDLRRRERLATLGELSGSVAHEIRNPLGVIKNSIYVLRHRLPAGDIAGHRQLDRIEKQVAAANRIISELLDFTREPTISVDRLVLQSLCARALAELEVPDFIETVQRLDGEPLSVVVDPHQIVRILDNLLRNAVQAMPDGGVLSVICERRGSWAVVSVRDSGIGISAADLGQIFEPLFTRKAKGIGLGLALSQRYARINGGRIECESQPGRGTMFRLFLPSTPG